MAPQSVIHRLRDHELGLAKSNYRSSLRILNSLIEDPGSRYKLVWQAESRKPIYFYDHKIFCNSFQTAFGLWGVNGRPGFQFKLQQKESFEEMLIHNSKINRLPVPFHLFAPLMLGLTRDNRIIRYHANTGEKLDTIFLGSVYKFVHLSWQVSGETMLLQSVYHKKSGVRDKSCLQAMALIGVNPFQFEAMIELSTDVLGNNAKNANVGENVLIIGYGRDTVRLFSMKDVLSDDYSDKLCFCSDFGDSCDRHGPIGAEGFGIPVTRQLKSLPPVLFQVRARDQCVHFGGFPFKYLIQGHGKEKQMFHLYDLMTENPVWTFDLTGEDEYGIDKCTFHEDESGRIIVAQSGCVSFAKITNSWGEKVQFDESSESSLSQSPGPMDSRFFPIYECSNQFQLRPEPEPLRTCKYLKQGNVSSNQSSRPRRGIYPRTFINAPVRPIFASDWEDELDYYSVLGIAGDDSSSISMFDNKTGEFIKRIPVPDLQEEDDHSIIVDLDHIIHLVKRTSDATFGEYSQIFVYQLTRVHPDQRENRKRKLKKQQGPGFLINRSV